MNKSPLFERIVKNLSDRKQSQLFRTLAEPGGMGNIDMSTNSYLWLQENPDIARSASLLVKNQLHGNCASRLFSSNSTLFRELESELADWERAESALVFNSGYAANLGIIQAVCTRSTEIFSDRLNHASIIDGIRLSRAKLSRFRHCDMIDLRTLLDVSEAKEKIIITDSVFSMDGDRAPLADICELARRFNCMIMVDEAHATGIFGKSGSGLVEEFGLEGDIDIRMGTLSKSVAGLGGYFAGSTTLRDFFINSSRSLIYSTALPHATLAWDLAAVRHIRAHPGLGGLLLEKARRFRSMLHGTGFNPMQSNTHIVPCHLGSEAAALSLSAYLKKNGINAPAVRPPTVPAGAARVRFSVNCGCTDDDITRVVDVLQSWRKSHTL